MTESKRRGRGRPGNFLARKETGIAFIDFVKRHEPELLSHLLEFQPTPCEDCQYHRLVAKAQELLRPIHENNIEVFKSNRGDGKRRLVPDLLRPFDLSVKSIILPGFRDPLYTPIKVIAELGCKEASVEGEAKDFRYRIHFDESFPGSGNRILTFNTRVDIKRDGGEWTSTPFGTYLEARLLENDVTRETFESKDVLDRVVAITLIKNAQAGLPPFLAEKDDKLEDLDPVLAEMIGVLKELDVRREMAERYLTMEDILTRAVILNISMAREKSVAKTTPEDTRPAIAESAREVILRIFRPVIDEIADRYCREVTSGRRKKRDDVRYDIEVIRLVAQEVGKVLILGPSPQDLSKMVQEIDKEKSLYPINRTLDRFLRYFVEWYVYWRTRKVIEHAQEIHRWHTDENRLQWRLESLRERLAVEPYLTDDERQIDVAKFVEYLKEDVQTWESYLPYMFDPYLWISVNKRVFDITSKAARKALAQKYMQVMLEMEDYVKTQKEEFAPIHQQNLKYIDHSFESGVKRLQAEEKQALERGDALTEPQKTQYTASTRSLTERFIQVLREMTDQDKATMIKAGEARLRPLQEMESRLVQALQEFSDEEIQALLELFGTDDLEDANGLAIKLRDAQNPLSRHLWGLFPPESQRLMNGSDDSSPTPDLLQKVLVDGLNKIIRCGTLFTEKRFAHVNLTSETRALIEQKPHGANLTYLNRLLLRDAFPAEISVSHQKGLEKACSENAIWKVVKEYMRELLEAEEGEPSLVERTFSEMPDKYHLQFSHDAYDPGYNQGSLTDYLQKVLPRRLDDYFRDQSDPPSKKEKNVDLEIAVRQLVQRASGKAGDINH